MEVTSGNENMSSWCKKQKTNKKLLELNCFYIMFLCLHACNTHTKVSNKNQQLLNVYHFLVM